MNIIQEYRYLFDKRVMKKGKLYFLKGNVSNVEVDGNSVKGVVQGRELNYPSIRFYQDNTPEMTCGCPYFSEWGKNCKHLWALILHLDYLVQENEIDFDSLSGRETGRRVQWSEVKDLIKGGAGGPKKRGSKKAGFHICYVIDRKASSRRGRLVFLLKERYRKLNGRWGRERDYSGRPGEDLILSGDDEKILTVFAGQEQMNGKVFNSGGYFLSGDLYSYVIPLMGRTGRLKIDSGSGSRDQDVALHLSQGWDFRIDIEQMGNQFRLRGVWTVGNTECSEDDITAIVPGEHTWLLKGNALYRNDESRSQHSPWEHFFLKKGAADLEGKDFREFIRLYNRQHGEIPRIDLAPSVGFTDIDGSGIAPLLYLHMSHGEFWGEPAFLYDREYEFSHRTSSEWFIDLKNHRRVKRDFETEKVLLEEAVDAGFVLAGDWLYCNPDSIHNAVAVLSKKGWVLYGENRKTRLVTGRMSSLQISTGIDWFEIEGDFDFSGQSIPVSSLLSGIQKGTGFIELGNGTAGLLPAKWLKRFNEIFAHASEDGEKLKISKSRIGVLDLFEEEPSVAFDSVYRDLKERIQNFQGIASSDTAAAFKGELRDYQKQGLGWLEFLDEFSFGGCLSDDMGLGKTVQLLAFLQKKKIEKSLSCLIVVPASIVFNWVNELQRFTPDLKFLKYWGSSRSEGWKKRASCDVILTSYSTMVRDIDLLSKELFDFVIFDESQNLKNPRSKRTIGARKLQAERLISLTGTPLENHLGDLWSQFSVINPGLFGSLAEFKKTYIDADNTEKLKKMTAPFIFRRTKEEVLTELPEKIEDVLKCEMTPEQREYYDEVRDMYRRKILDIADENGIESAGINVLEGLLRLRQICCSPRLVDRRRKPESGKLNSLHRMVEEVAEEGHKVLIFSQFVKMLGLIRPWLKKSNIPFEYLDGKTKDRERVVSSFQENPDIKVFLISLKAGGVGLNLTAADYVFLYDPWWNPAVEFQAVDRAHRIGQKNTVFTYRFITRESIEEKIQELQDSKKKMMNEIVSGSSGILSSLSKEDIEYLFS